MPALPTFARNAFTLYNFGYIVNGLASIITLCLMFSMWRAGRLKLNLYIKCAIQMSFLNLIYEVSAPLNSVALIAVPFNTGAAQGHPPTAVMMATGGIFLGGTGATIWSMMMLVGVLFTVHYGRQPTHKEQRISGVVVNLLLIAFAVQAMVRIDLAWYSDNPSRKKILNNYLVGRVALVVLSGICLLRLCQLMLNTSIKGQRSKSPLFHLLKKIAPYTIILAVVRFGASSYHWIYGEHPTKILANADGMQIFWLYVFVLLTPASSIGLMVVFMNVTAGAKRSLIQMLQLECIFTLPDAPDSWAEEGFAGESMKATYDRLMSMDEDALAAEVVSHTIESTSNAGRMSEQEEGGRERGAWREDFKPKPDNAGLHEI